MTATDLATIVPSGPPAPGPIEHRGGARDDVRMLVASSRGLADRHLRDLPDELDAGDVVVVNTSAVMPASVPGTTGDGTPVRVHLASQEPGGRWVVELRRPAGPVTTPFGDGRAGDVVTLPRGGRVRLVAPHAGRPEQGVRLWLAEVDLPIGTHAYLARHGSPIRYGESTRAWPLADYQTVFAAEPGSAESPSVTRAFTGALVAKLVAAGIVVAPITLHCGVSSPEAHEPPIAERFVVPDETAWLVNGAHARSRRVVAAGTTVVRALESAVTPDGAVTAAHGWTDLVIGPERGLAVVDGVLTGWHEPEASHLDLISAVAGEGLLLRSYDEAARLGYHWHEFGDTHLIWG